MIKNDFKLLLRSIFHQKINFLITLSGLVLGFTTLLLAFTLIRDEKGFDSFHKNAKDIFRVNKWSTDPSGEKIKLAETPGLMAAQLVKDYPEVKAATRLAPWFDEVLFSKDEQNIKVKKVVFVDSNFFQFFNFHLLRGTNPSNVLSLPGQVVLTPSLAKSLFGNEDPIGKTVKAFDKLFMVSGIVADAPRQSHIQYDALISWASTKSVSYLNFNFMNNWLGQTVYTYVQLGSASEIVSVNKKLPQFTVSYMPNRVGMYDFYLQPLSEIYLHSSDITQLRGGKYGSATFLQTFSFVALLILLIACFNYINITTAQSLKRAKEIGMKKLLGANKSQLLIQFFFETLVTLFFAAIVAVAIAKLLLPVFNNWFEKDIPGSELLSFETIQFMVTVILATSVITGIFPALLLLKFKSISIIRNKTGLSPKGEIPRQVLITLQLCISIGLIAGTLLLQKQFHFLLNRDLGFDKNQVIILKTPPGIKSNMDAFAQELRSLPDVKSFSICQAAMPEGTFGTTVYPEGSNGKEVPVQEFRVDTSYLKTYGLTMKEGRFLSRSTDSFALVVNETLVRQMGWKDPVGKTIRFGSNAAQIPVIGVVKDFNFNSLYQAITPLVMYLDNRKNNISIRFVSAHVSDLVKNLQRIWHKYEPAYPFEYSFLDEFLAKNYLKEKQLTSIISLFAAIAIFIACLGLYGLTSFIIGRRTKEIGIRKTLGASVQNIFGMLTMNFFKSMVIALLISTPLIWYFTHRWLQNFAFHVNPNVWVFVFAGCIMFLIVLITISFQIIKAALSNPVKSLRTE